MLEELSKKDKKWRELAFIMCQDKTLADDLVNDMYLKIHEKKYDKVTSGLVWRVLRSLYIDYIRKNKKKVMFSDYLENQDLYSIEDCKLILNERLLVNEALNELELFDREILLHTAERSLTKNTEKLGLSRMVLHYGKHKALKKLKNTNTIKNYKKKD